MTARRVVILAAAAIIVIILVTGTYYLVLPSGGSTTVTIVATGGQGRVAFAPANFTVKEGQQVTLVFLNHGSDSHELQIPVLGVDTGTVQPGATARVVFVPSKVGVFSFGEPPTAGPIEIVRENGMGNVTVLSP